MKKHEVEQELKEKKRSSLGARWNNLHEWMDIHPKQQENQRTNFTRKL